MYHNLLGPSGGIYYPKFVPCFVVLYLNNNAIYFSRWLHEINQNCDEVTRILVGNKCDDPDRRVVLKEDAMRFANQMGIQLFETSAKENINVEEMFRAITNLVLNSKKAQRETLGDPATGRIKVNDHVRPHKRGKDKKMCCN